MIEVLRDIDPKPYLIALKEIEIPNSSLLSFSKSELRDVKKITETLKLWKFNSSLPVACLGGEENRYQLLTGFPIYQASLDAGLQRLWVFLFPVQCMQLEKMIDEIILQLKSNKEIEVVSDADIESFLAFANNKDSVLTQVVGIGKIFESRIIEKRPLTKEKLQKTFGTKQSMNWIKAFKKIPRV